MEDTQKNFLVARLKNTLINDNECLVKVILIYSYNKEIVSSITASFIKPYRDPVYKFIETRQGFMKWAIFLYLLMF